MSKWIYDLEVYPNYFYALFKNENSGKYQSFEINPDVVINDTQKLISFLNTHGHDLVGWNSLSYDDVLLNYLLKGASNTNALYRASKAIIEPGPNDTGLINSLNKIRWNDRNNMVKSIDIKAILNPMPSLKKVEIRIRCNDVRDLPFNPHLCLDQSQIIQLKEYCEMDVNATEQVWVENKSEHSLRLYLEDKFNTDRLASASEAAVAESIIRKLVPNPNIAHSTSELYHYFRRYGVSDFVFDWIHFYDENLVELLHNIKNTVVPLSVKGYPDAKLMTRKIKIGNTEYQLGIGGLHSIDPPLININARYVDVDVVSYYPSIVINNGLYPKSFTKSWNNVYKSIRDERLYHKQLGNKVESNALKIIINSVFGKFGSRHSVNYDPHLLLSTTVNGQLSLLMLIEQLEANNYAVISANTDGITIDIGSDSPMAIDHIREIYHKWEIVTGFDLEETHYKSLIRRDVNNYLAVTINDEQKAKGIFNIPHIKKDTLVPIIAKSVVNYLLRGTPIEETINNHDDVFDFLYSFSATSEFKMYADNKEIQKSNRWYIAIDYDIQQLTKKGGKRNNVIKIPNSYKICLQNQYTGLKCLNNIDKTYYVSKAYKLLKELKDE